MKGRPAKPTSLKVLQGNPGKRALNKKEPKPAAGIPKCPAHLSKEAKQVWREVVPQLQVMRVLTLADAHALELYCDAMATYRQARQLLNEHGATYETGSQDKGIMYRRRPENEIAEDAWRRAHAALQQFGLTPSSRTKLKTEPEQPKDLLSELLG